MTATARALSASPAGEAYADFALPFTDKDLTILVLKVIGSVGRVRRKVRRIESQERRLLEDFGDQLFQAVFSGPVRECLGRSRLAAESRDAGLRIRLRLTPAPWPISHGNTCYDPEYGFLGLSPETALVRYLEMPAPVRPFPISPPLRILAMISAPADVPGLQGDEEWGKLNAALDDLIRGDWSRWTGWRPARSRRCSGRCACANTTCCTSSGTAATTRTPRTGRSRSKAQAGRTRLVTGRDLGLMIRGHRSLRLVVLNACEGARSARDDPFGGWRRHWCARASRR